MATARSTTLDAAVAVGAAAVLVLVTHQIPVEGGDRALDAAGHLALDAAGGAMGLCRRRPAVAVGIVAVALATYLVRDYAGGPIFVTGWVALVALGWRSTRRTALAGAVAFCAVLLAAATVDGDVAPLLHLVFVGWSVAAVLAGDALRSRRERLVEQAERARNAERLRIARDLHDTVAHAMATINVQAGAAAHVVDRRPEAAREALAAIQRASGEVLDELATMVRVLRDSGEAGDRAPTPGLERIADLVESARRADVDVASTVTGPLDRVPVPVSTAAYRVVQESLTNVARHAAGARATVTVTAGDDGGLAVEVADDGGAGPPPRERGAGTGTGTGITGMRERAEATGGMLQAGPRPGGGFVVRAEWRGAR
jgi:signal transduction histidine kinase